MKREQIKELLGRKRDWTPIAVLTSPEVLDIERLIEHARERRWRLVNLAKFNQRLPANVMPRGALVSALPTDPLVRELGRKGVPTVRIGTWPHPEDDRVPAVLPDREVIGRMAAEHFAQRDFKHVAFVGQDPWGRSQSLYEAFKSRARELGLVCHLHQVNKAHLKAFALNGGDRLDLQQQLFNQWLANLPRPVGLLALSDLVADRFCQWIIESERRVPEDVAVLGIGDTQFVCECAEVPLSSIVHDHSLLAETAVRMLEALMAGEELQDPVAMVPPLGIATRQSTDVLATTDPRVAQALQFMWDNITEDLSVDQIARHLGIPRRTLERAFRQDIGRGINQEFQRRRLEKARELLLQTDMRIVPLAEALNFSSHNYFCRIFRAAFGCSPTQYRREHRRHP